MKNNYLYSEAKRIIVDRGYNPDDFDLDYIVKDFDERYSPEFSEWKIWSDVIEEYAEEFLSE